MHGSRRAHPMVLDHHRIDDQVQHCGRWMWLWRSILAELFSRHVAQQIVDSLGLRKEAVGTEIRYVKPVRRRANETGGR